MDDIIKKLAIFLIIAAGILFVLKISGISENFSLSSIQNFAGDLKVMTQQNYFATVVIFFAVFVFINLWFPAAAVLTLLAGYLFGSLLGALYVDAAATSGAAISFIVSRKFAGNWVQVKWKDQLAAFNRDLDRNGYIYLLIVRLIPMMPYILINILAGLTKVRLKTFLWTTAVASLPGILVFSFAGKQLLNIKSVNQLFTPKVIIAFALIISFLGISLVIRKILVKKYKTRYLNLNNKVKYE